MGIFPWESLMKLTNEGWLEEHLWTAEPLVADGDDLSIG